jgi:hypothetical protein
MVAYSEQRRFDLPSIHVARSLRVAFHCLLQGQAGISRTCPLKCSDGEGQWLQNNILARRSVGQDLSLVHGVLPLLIQDAAYPDAIDHALTQISGDVVFVRGQSWSTAMLVAAKHRRRAVRTRGHFANDESAMKLLLLVLNLAGKEWRMKLGGIGHCGSPVRHPLRRTPPGGLKAMINPWPVHEMPRSPRKSGAMASGDCRPKPGRAQRGQA